MNDSILTKKNENDMYSTSAVEMFLDVYFLSLFRVLLLVVCVIGWGYLFQFSIPWPGGEEYPNWDVGFCINHEPLTNNDSGNLFYIEIFEEFTSILYLLQVVILFYCLPFGVASITLCFISPSNWKLPIGIIFGLIIFFIQILFGYCCYDVWHTKWDDVGSISEHILLYGGFGIFFAITYGVVLYFSYNALLASERKTDKLKALLPAHFLAFLDTGTIIAIVWTAWIGLILYVVYLVGVGAILAIFFGIKYIGIFIMSIVSKMKRK